MPREADVVVDPSLSLASRVAALEEHVFALCRLVGRDDARAIVNAAFALAPAPGEPSRPRTLRRDTLIPKPNRTSQ